ncbi:ROK family protein [Pedococcus ginsenosidimutans]|uniref:ROK family protein n=1 Tax=Pedococcus ginsenosidimutans TaxID=490570 RepID=A0ABP8Y0K6_9MICO
MGPQAGATDLVAAVDVGGTRTKAALVARGGREVVSATVPTPAGCALPGVLVQHLERVVRDLLTADAGSHHVVACGVVVPGLVDDKQGVARWSANLGWRDLPVGAPLSGQLGLPVALGHDVRAGLVAEARLGAARDDRHVLFVPVGTGIAGALMVDGHVLLADGYAGELGHVVVDPTGPECGCGARGCLEAIASAAAVERAYASSTLPAPDGAGRASAERVASLVEAGDVAAQAVWDVAVEALARAVTMAVTLTGVDLVLVGGGLAQSGETLLGPLRTAVRDRLTFQRMPRVERPLLGDRAGCLGAACLAWDLV